MGILSWIVIGLLAGGLARLLLPGRQRLGCFATTAVGVLGGLLGGFLATLLGFGGISGFDLRSLAIATAGALLLILVFGLGSGRGK
ncbi:MAG TPA: GlsB/YeaQ/YmgE family stress response membrane protein [Thermoanaerobaculia bacterium]|nr:GlsB/YeaQ/YmgE family stress response membrane protein [Thermoanaerobaculia bacterium]